MRNLFVVEDVDPDAFRNKRVLFECFFGRLKKKYGVFGAKWTMSVELFDIFFDCACAMTNVDIMFSPLRTRWRLQRGNRRAVASAGGSEATGPG